MASQYLKFKLTAVVTIAALGYLVGCGTAGNNTGFKEDPNPNLNFGLSPGPGPGPGPGPAPAGGLDLSATGTAVVNTGLAPTTATGLTISQMISTTGLGGSGATLSCTRLAIANFGATLGTKVVVAQGNGNFGQGRITLLPRNPDATPGTSNIVLNKIAGTFATAIVEPFAVLAEANTVYFTNNFRAAGQGALVRVTNIAPNGDATFDVVGVTGAVPAPLTSLNWPIDIVRDGSFLYVAEYAPSGTVGQIRRINETTNAVDVLVTNVNFPSAMVLDTSSGRRLLYVAENGPGSASGAFGGIARIDLTTFTPGSPLTVGGVVGAATSIGVTFIPPVEVPTVAYSNPFDLAIDDKGNVAISEGITYFPADQTANTFTAPANQGRIRVIQGNTTPGGTPSTTSRIIVTASGPSSTLAGTRGLSIQRSDNAGDADTVFFIDGPIGTNSNTRQVTFRNTDGGIFRYLTLDTGKLNALDTLFDAGATGVAANVKYTVSFPGTFSGQVFDIR